MHTFMSPDPKYRGRTDNNLAIITLGIEVGVKTEGADRAKN
jgi:hypothetical protein